MDGEIDRSEVMFVVEMQTFGIADRAAGAGMVPMCATAGGKADIVSLMLFF